MVVPFIALIVILAIVAWVLVGASKKKSQGEDLGDTKAGA